MSISQFINNLYCWIYSSYTLHILFHCETKFTLFYLLSFAFIRFHSLHHSLPPVVPLVVIRCHLLYHSLLFIVIPCHCCTTCCHSLSLNVSLVCLFINDHFQTKNIFRNSKHFPPSFLQPVDVKVSLKLSEKNVSCHYTSTLFMQGSLLCQTYWKKYHCTVTILVMTKSLHYLGQSIQDNRDNSSTTVQRDQSWFYFLKII